MNFFKNKTYHKIILISLLISLLFISVSSSNQETTIFENVDEKFNFQVPSEILPHKSELFSVDTT
jgi:hypothetical protein